MTLFIWECCVKHVVNAMSRRCGNVSAVTAKFLAARLEALRLPDSDQPLASKSAAQLWHEWFVIHQRRERITEYQQKLEKQMRDAAGGFPVVETAITGQQSAVVISTLAELDQLAARLSSEKLSELRSRLRRRKKQWKDADKKLGYSAALAFETDLSDQERNSARLLWKAESASFVDAIAKLHCLIEMEDPGMKLKQAPWPRMKTILADLVRIAR